MTIILELELFWKCLDLEIICLFYGCECFCTFNLYNQRECLKYILDFNSEIDMIEREARAVYGAV